MLLRVLVVVMTPVDGSDTCLVECNSVQIRINVDDA
jgi:hypothetical protein